jgi:hypothetical protein
MKDEGMAGLYELFERYGRGATRGTNSFMVLFKNPDILIIVNQRKRP